MFPHLIFIDMDGTLIDEKQEVPNSAINALNQVKAAGHRIILSTGRTLPEIYPFIFDLGFSGVIGSGGSFCEIDKIPLFDHRFDLQDILLICHYTESHNGEWLLQLPTVMHHSDGYFNAFIGGDKYSQKIRGDWSPYMKQISPYLRRGMPDTASKCSINFPPNSDLSIRNIREDLGSSFHIVPGSLDVTKGITAELQLVGCDKGSALVEVAKYFSVPLEKTIAIGDSANDLEAIQKAGIGIAMGNASNGIKEASDLVTTSIHDDGLAHALSLAGLF